MKEPKKDELEFATNEILQNMYHNTFNNFNSYDSNNINKNYLSLRNSILNIMQKITMKFRFKSQTFFLTAYFFDIILIKKKKININIFKVGLACLCLASKFCENDPMVPQLQYFMKIYNNITGYKNFISMTELIYTEVVVCKILKYKLNYFTTYDFIAFFFCHGILKFEQTQEIENEININKNKSSDDEEFEVDKFFVKNILGKIYRTVRNYLDIIVKIDKICMKYNPLYVSIYLIQKSMDECLEDEYKRIRSNLDKEELKKNVKNFLDRNNMYYKEIMNEFYKIHYNDNEQYLQLIIDDEINYIFKKQTKNKNNQSNVKEDKEESRNSKLFNSTMTSGFYKRLQLPLNNEQEKENIKENNDFINNETNNNNENEKINQEDIKNNENKDSNNVDEDDDLDSNLNINELQKEMNLKNSHIEGAKNNPKTSTNKMNSINKIEKYKTLELKTEKNKPIKYNKLKENNFRKTHIPKSNTFSIKTSSSFKTLEKANKPYTKKLISGNNRNIAKSFNESFKSSTSTNFYQNKLKNITKNENNNVKGKDKNSGYPKDNNLKEKPRIINTAITKKFKKIVLNKNELSSKSIRSKKIFGEKYNSQTFTASGENFYSSNYNKINVNKLKDQKESEIKNLNINKELRTKKIATYFYKNNLNISNTTKNIKKLKEKNNTNEFKSKYNTSRNDEKNENISLSKINNNFIQIKNDKKKEIKKIIFKNKPNNNSIREGYTFKNLNNINNNETTKNQYKTINKETHSVQQSFSSFYNLIQRTKKLFNSNKDDNNTKINNNNINDNKNQEEKDFYKSKEDFYKRKNKTNDINDEKETKNTNTIIINNNININIGNKKEIKIPQFNFNNTIVTSQANNINLESKFHTQRIKNPNNTTTKKGITIKSIFQKLNINKKINNKDKK